ncbi:MAG: Ig domain-containing protein [Acidovorax sp.]|jgi:hypothetical protein
MKKSFSLILLAISAVLSACGGGGGSAGETQAVYVISLRAEKPQLPLNVAGVGPGIGVYSPYTTTLYVEAKKGGLPIPGGLEIFGCNLAGGLDSGSLYYLDGDPAHETEVTTPSGATVKVPNAYRSITLGSNSGGNSFHFHAGNQAGTARITCSVTDPRDRQVKSASVNIAVGGGATGQPASVRIEAQIPGYLGTRGNANGLLSQMALQAFVLDDTNQPTPAASGSTVQVRILSGTSAGQAARLVAGPQSGSVLQLPTIGGIATFSLLGGVETGPVFLEITADRFDNNVANGVSDPIVAIHPISVLEAVTAPPVFAGASLGTITKGIQFTSYLTVTGGLPPYTWSATGLPPGLGVDALTGVISGKVTADAEERLYRATVTVTDRNKISSSGAVTVTVVGGLPEDFAIGDCNGTTVCSLGSAPAGVRFSYSFVSSVSGVTWTFTSLPIWLTSGTTPTAGVLNGTPTVADCGTSQFLVTAAKGDARVTRRFSITVVSGSTPALTCP